MKDDREKFIEKRKFGIPLDTFVEIELSANEISRIRGWIKNGDSIRVCPYHRGSRVVLVNETKLWGLKRKNKLGNIKLAELL